jgi:hypothetical protein
MKKYFFRIEWRSIGNLHLFHALPTDKSYSDPTTYQGRWAMALHRIHITTKLAVLINERIVKEARMHIFLFAWNRLHWCDLGALKWDHSDDVQVRCNSKPYLKITVLFLPFPLFICKRKRRVVDEPPENWCIGYWMYRFRSAAKHGNEWHRVCAGVL